MSIISIREQYKTETGFKAVLSFDRETEYPIAVENPFLLEQEAELEWYFEQWLVYPFIQTVRAEQARDSVRSYGEALFEQVFKQNADAYSEYRATRDALTQIEIIGDSTEFQALHWETLHDPQMPRSLAVDCVMVRKRVKATAVKATVAPAPVIRLLVVTARPGEEHDVDHRTISRPLMELIQQSQLRVQVDLLRPATFEALTAHLDDKGAGYYHIVHLDMHGAVVRYDQLESIPHGPFTFRFGESIKPFDGVQAFLSFESGTPGKSDLRSAAELARLLTGKQIPVCILNACQSAKQIPGDERETSLGAALMAAGMQTVLAMGYSVTVSAAAILMKTLYEQLFAGKGLDEAIRLGRKALCDRKERHAYFNQTIELEDWLLPVVYRRGQVDLGLRPFTPQEDDSYWQQQESLYRFGAPTYGFFGRDLEILKIERALLRQNVLLVQGMGGTGKTTLLNYLREWWQTTQFVKDVFYFGYDQRAYTLEQILFAIGQRVYKCNEVPQVAKLVATLRAEPYTLMLDNLESVTGQALAIQNTLDVGERAKLRDFLQRLVGGKTKVVLGSRGREQWLDGVLRGAVYELRGLDKEARTKLADEILARHVQINGMPDERTIDKIRQSDDFHKLMKLLAGYPLAMEVVLGNLRRQTGAEILARLDAADVTLDSSSEERTASILKCVEYSHSNLSADAQKLLVCLAPFSGFLFRSALPNYAKQLQQLSPFQDYPFEQLDSAIQEAINWGLLSPLDANNPHLLTIQPVFPYFLKTKLNQFDGVTRESLFEGFKNHYRDLATYYTQLMGSMEPQERQTGIIFCQLEYENLYSALQLCLTKQEEFSAILNCLVRFLELNSSLQDQLRLAQEVEKASRDYASSFWEGSGQKEFIFLLDALGLGYWQVGKFDSAKQIFLRKLDFVNRIQKRDSEGITYTQLSEICRELRQLDEGYQYGLEALSIFRELDSPDCQANVLHTLGLLEQRRNNLENARKYHQQASELYKKTGNAFHLAKTYHELGIIAQKLGQYEQAKAEIESGLRISEGNGDCSMQARHYHQLGVVSENLHRYTDAIDYYQKALGINIQLNNLRGQADTYTGLCTVEVERYRLAQAKQEVTIDHLAQAKQYGEKALEIFIAHNNQHSEAGARKRLGVVARLMQEYEQARSHYHEALQIFKQFENRASEADIYFELGLLAVAEKTDSEARDYWQRAKKISIESGDERLAALVQHNLDLLAG